MATQRRSPSSTCGTGSNFTNPDNVLSLDDTCATHFGTSTANVYVEFDGQFSIPFWATLSNVRIIITGAGTDISTPNRQTYTSITSCTSSFGNTASHDITAGTDCSSLVVSNDDINPLSSNVPGTPTEANGTFWVRLSSSSGGASEETYIDAIEVEITYDDSDPTFTGDSTAPSEVTVLDTICYDGEGADIEMTMENATFYGEISNYTYKVYMFESDMGDNTPTTIKISKDNGVTYCSGHTELVDANNCNASQDLYTGSCSHDEAPLLDSEARDNDIKIKVEAIGGIPFTNFAQHVWTYAAGDKIETTSDTRILKATDNTTLSDTRIKNTDKVKTSVLLNTDFEHGAPEEPPFGWTGNANVDTNAWFAHDGNYGVRLSNSVSPYIAAYIEQDVRQPVLVSDFTSLSYWIRVTTAGGGALVRATIIFTDVSEYYREDQYGDINWHQETITQADLNGAGHSAKTIETVKFERIGSSTNNSALDSIVFTDSTTNPLLSDTTIQVAVRDSRSVERTVQLDGRDSRSVSRIVQLDGRTSRSISRIVQLDGRDSRSISRDIFLLQEFTKTSDSTVMKIGEISRVSNTVIFAPDQEVTKTSDSAIYREGYETLDVASDARIKILSQEITSLSDSHIKTSIIHRRPPKNNLVAWYPLDYDFNDYSGNEYDGINDGATFVDGHINNAAQFIETEEDKVEIMTTYSAIVTGITIAAWVKGDSTGSARGIVYLRNSIGDHRFNLYYEGTYLAVYIKNASGGAAIGSGVTLSTTQYQFLVATYDGITTRIYVDGVEKNSMTTISGDILLNGTPDHWIGSQGPLGAWWDGQIDDVTIYDKALTQKEIESLSSTAISSISTIFHPQYGDIEVSSDARIVEEGTIVIPPILSDAAIYQIAWEHPFSGTLGIDYFGHLDITSDTVIHREPIIDKTSDTTIFVSQYGDVTKTSDTAIFRSQYGDVTKLSDAAIFRSQYGDITKLSNTRIKREAGYKYPFQKQEKISDTRIFVPDNILNITSITRIKEIDNQIDKTSDTLIIHNPSIQKTSDTFILIPFTVSTPSRTRIKNTMEISITSDATIFRLQYGDIIKLSDTVIFREPVIDKTSDTRIRKLFEFNKLSDTYIINEGTQIDITSDTAIFRAGYGHIIKESRAAIKGLDQEITKLSDSVILRTFSFSKISDTAIRRDLPPMVTIFRKSRQL